jgi:predicted esterase
MRLALAVVLSLCLSAAGQSTRESRRNGTHDVSFDQRSPLSELSVQVARYGVDRSKAQIYETAKEKFFIVVPAEYENGAAGWGLMLWCNAGRGGRMPEQLEALLATKKLIGVGAYDAGNDRGVAVRIGLALDAVHNLRQRYTLDEKRTYLAGVSGGGKVAQMAAMAYPDVFDGAICCAGANWYKDIAVPDQRNKFWPATFRKPPGPQFVDAREHVGFVLIAGEKDPNREPVKAILEQGFTAEKFKHVTFYDVPGLGHRPPEGEWFERAIEFLDAVPKDRVKKSPATKRTSTP